MGLTTPRMNFPALRPTSDRSPPCPRVSRLTPAGIIRTLAVFWLAGFGWAQVHAQMGTTPPTPPGQRPPELGSLGDNVYWSGAMYGSPNSPQSLDPVFLPALLPVLGEERPANPVPLAANYPREFAGEPFFMAYANLAARDQLSAKRSERIARYRTARLILLTELREQLTRTTDAAAETRERALAGLAATQTSRLLELEVEAEEIRDDLTRREAFKIIASDIGDLPSRTEATERSAALATLRLLLSAAHFRDGFSSDQRRLLEEMAQETLLTLQPEPEASSPRAVFFWPAGARIPAPKNLAPEVAAQFVDFQRRKAALKNELRATLDRGETHILNLDRSEAYAKLATTQTRPFAELEALAEQLRPALAALAGTGASAVNELPADLANQVASIVERKAALQRELYSALMKFRRELPDDQVELIRQSGGIAISVLTEKGNRRTREAVLARILAFNEDISSRFKVLATDRDAMRTALARYQATVPGAKADVSVDRLAADFLAAYNARGFRNSQREYADAVFAPGLSPAQRRLLLRAVGTEFLHERAPAAP